MLNGMGKGKVMPIVCAKCRKPMEIQVNGILIKTLSGKYYRADIYGCHCGHQIIMNMSEEINVVPIEAVIMNVDM